MRLNALTRVGAPKDSEVLVKTQYYIPRAVRRAKPGITKMAKSQSTDYITKSTCLGLYGI